MKKKKGPSSFKRFIWLGLVLFLCFGMFYSREAAPVLTAYYAKNLCSCVFLSGRTAEHVMNNELAPYSAVSANVDVSKQLVTAHLYGFFEKQAYYRDGLGCTIINKTSIEELDKQALGFKPYRASQDTFQFKPFVQDSTLSFTLDQAKLQSVLTQEFQQAERKQTRAVLILHDSTLIVEQYAEGFDQNTQQQGWSMTKSITATLIGVLAQKGNLTVQQSHLFPEWAALDDPRGEVTLDQLLRMSSGLEFEDNYFHPSDATHMLFKSASTAKLASEKRQQFKPGSYWHYSSGTSNILSQLIRNNFGNRLHRYWNFPQQELFSKLGITSFTIEPDATGTFVGSSFSYGIPKDWAKLGLLYLRDGVWNNERILPEGWTDYVSTPTPNAKGGRYGAHFWMDSGDDQQEKAWKNIPKDLYYMSGFDGQSVAIIPSRNLVIVRLSYSQQSGRDYETFLEGVLSAFVAK